MEQGGARVGSQAPRMSHGFGNMTAATSGKKIHCVPSLHSYEMITKEKGSSLSGVILVRFYFFQVSRSYGNPLAAWKRAHLMSASFCRSSSLRMPLPSVSTKAIKRLIASSAWAIVGFKLGAETPGPQSACP